VIVIVKDVERKKQVVLHVTIMKYYINQMILQMEFILVFHFVNQIVSLFQEYVCNVK